MIGDIQIERSRVRIELRHGETKTALLLVHKDAAPDSAQKTASFAIQLADNAPSDESLQRSIKRITSLISQGDDGNYFVEIETPKQEKRRDAGTSLDIEWVLSFLLLLGSVLVMRRPQSATIKLDLPIALALMATAFALRVALGPMTFLHENAHGVHLLEQIAGLSFVERPMAGQIALGRFVSLIAAPSLASLTATVALVSAVQASLAYLICRTLNIERHPAVLGGLLVATLPILVRMTASEGAFGPATTFLMLGVLFAIQAAKQTSGRHLVGALVFVSIAGHFRPVMYTAALPVALTVFFLSPSDERKRWLSKPIFYAAGVVFFLCTLDDLSGLLSRLNEGSPMTPGWWQGNSIHSWPLVDPESTPIWFLPLAMVASAVAWKKGRISEVLWLTTLGLWLTFVYTSDNAWPASLRYAIAYAWISPIVIALGLNELPKLTSNRNTKWAMGVVLVLSISAPISHSEFISYRFAQQEEVDFQTTEVHPHLLGQKGAKIVTPWPELNHMSGTLNTTPLKLHGHEIVHHTDIDKVRFSPTVYWYRGLACWTKRDSDEGIDVSAMNETCRNIEARYVWTKVAHRKVQPSSDADWIQIGNGRTAVEIALFVRKSMAP